MRNENTYLYKSVKFVTCWLVPYSLKMFVTSICTEPLVSAISTKWCKKIVGAGNQILGEEFFFWWCWNESICKWIIVGWGPQIFGGDSPVLCYCYSDIVYSLYVLNWHNKNYCITIVDDIEGGCSVFHWSSDYKCRVFFASFFLVFGEKVKEFHGLGYMS